MSFLDYKKPNQNYRNITAFISPYTINNIDLKNPYIIAWWSAAFPGYGHLALGYNFIGIILIVHESAINTLSGLNTAIVYSFIGEFSMAKQSLDIRWLLAYIPPYLFSIWDSYQRTIQLNEDYVIARQRGYQIIFKGMSAYDMNRLDRKSPIAAVIWSFLAPGSGHIYINRIPTVILATPWLILVFYFSKLIPAIHYTLLGNFELARSVVDPQWLIILPSIYGFVAYDAYLHTMEYNKLYKIYHMNYLKKAYQESDFHMPI
jgi:hypothetical protein